MEENQKTRLLDTTLIHMVPQLAHILRISGTSPRRLELADNLEAFAALVRERRIGLGAMSMVYYCGICHCPRIQGTVWIDINTEEVFDEYNGGVFCPRCDQYEPGEATCVEIEVPRAEREATIERLEAEAAEWLAKQEAEADADAWWLAKQEAKP